MGTIASLLGMLGDTQPRPWDMAQRSLAEGETSLATLADLKRKQAAEAAMFEQIKNDPALAQQLFGGGPVLGSLQQPQGPPGAGPMTQQTVQPGQPPGAPQTVPGGMDLSQFATQGGPPQSTIGSLGPAGQSQPQMQPPRNPLLEMARTRSTGSDDAPTADGTAARRQYEAPGAAPEDGLGHDGFAGADSAGRDRSGQAGIRCARMPRRSIRSSPHACRRCTRKEAKERVITQALSVKENLTLQVQDLTAQAAVIKARKEGRSVDVDNQLRAMGVQPGQETPEQIKEALRLVQEGKIAVSASHGQGQLRDSPLGVVRVGKDDKVEYVRGPNGEILQPKPTAAEQTTATFANLARKGHESAVALENKGFQPGFWEKAADKLPLDMGNYLTSDDYQKYKDHVTDFAQAWLRETSKGAITQEEWDLVNKRYFPQPGNSKAQVEAKRQAREQVIKELEAVGAGTGRTGTGGQAGATSGAFKPLKEMSREERLAERDALRRKAGQ